ncbi:hypothetical protein LNP74_27915 [Klebsiella pneumoniae subsp. pneumoniae]|nr:hypothetical protein [Klebsiella pneumoniae subsp. pneumoniae]
MDDGGFLAIVDRKKDMILVSGFKRLSERGNREDVVCGSYGVLEVAAIGVPSGSSGEAVKIFVVKKDKERINRRRALITFCAFAI